MNNRKYLFDQITAFLPVNDFIKCVKKFDGNYIRTDPSRGATTLSSIDLNGLLDEKGREMWCEGWRRQDLIRFKKFLLPFHEKDYQSDSKYLLFLTPDNQLAVNPFLKQNPRY
jgi:hypothetical protein